jgi:hypothetical protein
VSGVARKKKAASASTRTESVTWHPREEPRAGLSRAAWVEKRDADLPQQLVGRAARCFGLEREQWRTASASEEDSSTAPAPIGDRSFFSVHGTNLMPKQKTTKPGCTRRSTSSTC